MVTSVAVDNGVCGSDSDSKDLPEYYHPISSSNNGGGEDEGDLSDQDSIHHFHRLPNDLSPLDLSGDDREEDEKEEDEEEAATAPERAIERVFREDERRRTAPLTENNAARVMEVMRRISFGGTAPDWVSRVPEDQIDRLQSLSRPSN